MKKRTLYIIAAVAATAFIFANSLKTAAVSDASSNTVIEYLECILTFLNIKIPPEKLVFPIRKAAHFTEFFIQGALLTGCFKGKYQGRIINILFFGLLTACTDEFIQSFVPGRGSLVSDVFIDFAGTCTATLFMGLFKMRRKKKHVK